jgi:hypothetical protein
MEAVHSVRLVVLDVEGVLTLPGGSQHPWPLGEWLVIRRFLADCPVACVLCTGRQAPYGEAVIQALDAYSPLPAEIRERALARSGHDFLAWPSVLEHGAYFYDPLAKRAVPHPVLTPERTTELGRIRAEILTPLAARTGAQLEAGKDFCLSLNPPPIAPGSAERQSTDTFRPAVDAALAPFSDLVEVSHSKSAVDITPRGISKASAVRLLLDWTGLASEQVLGVGDTRADAGWLAEVGWRAAPANGREALPGMHYYSPFEVAEGLLDILRRLAENECEGV